MQEGEKPIDPAKEGYKPYLESAVETISAQSGDLRKVVSSKLLSGTTRVVAGIIYELNVEITWDDASVDQYEATVHKALFDQKISVLSWRPV
jgi:hypothetical protein